VNKATDRGTSLSAGEDNPPPTPRADSVHGVHRPKFPTTLRRSKHTQQTGKSGGGEDRRVLVEPVDTRAHIVKNFTAPGLPHYRGTFRQTKGVREKETR